MPRRPAALGLVLGLAQLLNAAPAGADRPLRPWHDDFLARLEALALLETLNAELLSHDSATVTLEHWCAAHALAEPARIVAERVRGAEPVASRAQRQLLGVGAAEVLHYRRVRLRCGAHVLSEADNWYVPERLAPGMEAALAASEVPFGRVIAPLHFQRRTLAAERLWSPLPAGWESGASSAVHDAGAQSALVVPAQVLRHHALLLLPDGAPLALLTETYTAEVLAFPEPPR